MPVLDFTYISPNKKLHKVENSRIYCIYYMWKKSYTWDNNNCNVVKQLFNSICGSLMAIFYQNYSNFFFVVVTYELELHWFTDRNGVCFDNCGTCNRMVMALRLTRVLRSISGKVNFVLVLVDCFKNECHHKKWKWKCVIFKCYSSEKLIILNTLHEVVPTWYSFYIWVDWSNADKVSCSRRKHIDAGVRTV